MDPVGFFAGDQDVVALVTGAASGIGAATARRLALEGVSRMVLTDRDGPKLAAAAAEIGLNPENVMTATFKVADDIAWGTVMTVVRQRFGRLDLVVANAGIAAGGAIVDYPFTEWRRVMSTNLDGVFLTLQHCLRLIQEGGRGGSIVVVSSATAVKAELGTATYGASKAAILQLAKVAAKEGAPHNIRVNSILPGGVETSIWREVPFFRDMVAKTGDEQAAFNAMAAIGAPLGRFSKADEIAGQIAFLLSDTAANITGAELLADGGYAL
jgi:NAD(P)-dependent dehydrogenase (short-subunit alcohol dehydrogenase family)